MLHFSDHGLFCSCLVDRQYPVSVQRNAGTVAFEFAVVVVLVDYVMVVQKLG